MTSTLPEVHQGRIGDNLHSTTITDAWEVFGELWTQDTVMEKVVKVMEEVDKVVDTQEELTHPMNTPKKITIRWGR